VIALDVGRGQLDWRLRNDRRVHVLEGVNARELTAEQLPFRPQLATIDVSFISLTKVLPAVAGVLREDGEVLAMVKPQFELGPERVGKGGVVRDPDARREAVLAVARCAAELGLAVRGFTPSGLPGPKGNRETFVWAARRGPGAGDLEAALAGVDV
jgi:23S rRNA (cytidine1920-2'-O)/16S rRNA (cytidine1409-2'-O)-methyltransferase